MGLWGVGLFQFSDLIELKLIVGIDSRQRFIGHRQVKVTQLTPLTIGFLRYVPRVRSPRGANICVPYRPFLGPSYVHMT